VPLLVGLAAVALTGFTATADELSHARDEGARVVRNPAINTAMPWQPVWSDEFDGPAGAAPDPAQWRFDLGRGPVGGPIGWGNNEVETYTADPANIALDGQGHLRITATRDRTGQWSSARIETARADFAPPAGGSLKVEARIELPGGARGYWPAFWMLGEPFRAHPESWPTAGEIDVMENINNSADVYGTLHCGTPPGPCHEKSGRTHSYTLPAPAGSAGPHTYTIIWDTAPERLSWQVDGHTYGSLTPADVGRRTWDEAFGHGYYLLLNLAVGGDLPGPPNSLTIPGESMLIDYVRVFAAS
jgi:beta-glucanase (GH16 family)